MKRRSCVDGGQAEKRVEWRRKEEEMPLRATGHDYDTVKVVSYSVSRADLVP